MQDAIEMAHAVPNILPGRRIQGDLVSLFTTADRTPTGFCTSAVPALEVDFEGIVGNRHRGYQRPADSRVPYLKRGTPMRNARMLSLVSVEDLAEAATLLGVAHIEPHWIGANILVSGIPRFSFLPRGSRLFFKGGAILIVEDQNAPCRYAGAAIANATGNPDVEVGFPKHCKRLRGVVATVERPGHLTASTALDVKLPEQWIYC